VVEIHEANTALKPFHTVFQPVETPIYTGETFFDRGYPDLQVPQIGFDLRNVALNLFQNFVNQLVGDFRHRNL
jgi:hypothetical protein